MEIRIITDGIIITEIITNTTDTTIPETVTTAIEEAETKTTTVKDLITTLAITNPSEVFEIMTFQIKERKWTNVLRDSILVKIVILDKTLIQVG